jgi:hypothetical protein
MTMSMTMTMTNWRSRLAPARSGQAGALGDQAAQLPR